MSEAIVGLGLLGSGPAGGDWVCGFLGGWRWVLGSLC